MNYTRPTVFFVVLAMVLASDLMAPPPAAAYDPATTHAGLTERAVFASGLHRVLSKQLGRPLGLLEPLQVHTRTLPTQMRRAFWSRLGALDPAGGYRPDNEGISSALAWVVAGTVLAKTPPERGRHHFFDPRRREGLDDNPGLTGFVHTMRLALDNASSAREIATGGAFDLTGLSSLEWLAAAQNDQGLPAFLDHFERAATAPDAAIRETSLVRALIALGGIVAVLEDAGEPAHVRNDFRASFLKRQGPSSWDRGSSFERFVAARYGRTGVPSPAQPVRRPSLEAYFTGADGSGLADRTQRRFFSEGTLPPDIHIDARTTSASVLERAWRSLEYPAPVLPALDLHHRRIRYVTVDGLRVLAYVRAPDRVRFFLDDAVYADTARVLLPEVGAYAAGLIDHLTRARVEVSAANGELKASLQGTQGPTGGTLRVFAEDASGTRKELPGLVPSSLATGTTATFTAPTGAKKLVIVARGKDASGPFVAVGETTAE